MAYKGDLVRALAALFKGSDKNMTAGYIAARDREGEEGDAEMKALDREIKQQELERKYEEGYRKGAPATHIPEGTKYKIKDVARLAASGLRANVGDVAPGAVEASVPSAVQFPASTLTPENAGKMGLMPEMTEQELTAGSPETKLLPGGGLDVPEVKPLQKTRLPPETTDIDILAYDPLDPTKTKKVGSFRGRVGMSPKMIPINNQLTEGQSATIASQDVALGNLNKMYDVMQRGNIGEYGQLAAQYVSNPTALAILLRGLEVSGAITPEQSADIQDYNSELNSAKQNIAVARGGKQLTITELELITNTLPRAVQNPSVWNDIVNRYSNEFDTYRTTLKGGKSSIEPVTRGSATTKTTPTQGSATTKVIGGKTYVKQGNGWVLQK